MMDDEKFMRRAIELALLAEQEGNLPIGTVITLDSEVVAEGRNAIWVPVFDATRHAEMEALRAIPADHRDSFKEMTLYTSLEPCLMCFGSILLHGIGRVVFGATDSYGGPGYVLANLPPFFQGQFGRTQSVGPIMASECDQLHYRALALERAR